MKNSMHVILYKYKNFNNYRNIGDWIQTLAVKNVIDKLYKNPNYSFVERDEIRTNLNLSGVCIHQGFFSDTSTINFIPNNNIKSIWIGTHLNPLVKKILTLDNFNLHDDFGCRDKETAKFFRHINKHVYLSRCLTLTFDKRKNDNLCNKIICTNIDITNVNSYIKDRKNIINISHDKFKSFQDNYKNLQYAKNLLDFYKNNAKLVVTTKLHAVCPCIAMGIPVIFINNGIAPERFSTLDGIIPQYTIDDLVNNRINWNPNPVDIEDLKQLMIRNVELSINKKLGLEYNNDELIDIRSKIENYNIL